MRSHLDSGCEECRKSAAEGFDQRSTREHEAFARVAEATAKVQAAYSTARKLLVETGNETLLAELAALALALDELASLATSRSKPPPSDR
jgi:hypothetical protein